jgi:hypothetical protein
MCQKQDRLKGIDNFYFGIQSWIQVRPSLMNIPTTFKWVHLWADEDFKPMRAKCCMHFGLDWSIKEERGKLCVISICVVIQVIVHRQTFIQTDT